MLFSDKTVLVSPVIVELKLFVVACRLFNMVLMLLKLLARLVTSLIAIGKVAYWLPPVVPPPVVPPEPPSVLDCRTWLKGRGVVLGGTCQTSVQVTVASLLL